MSNGLNLDILHLVMSLSDRTTVSRVMKTCRILNQEGARHILRGRVTIRDAAGAGSLAEYVLANRDTVRMMERLRWLTSLRLDISQCQDNPLAIARVITPFFISAASYADNFTELVLDDFETVFAADPELPSAIAALGSLTRLELDWAGPTGSAMLGRLRSQLLHVEVRYDLDYPSLADTDRDSASLVHHSTPTLLSMSLQHAKFSTSAPVYPVLRRLVLADVDLVRTPTRHLVSTFPHLAILYASDRPSLLHHDDVEERREENLAAQREHGSWTSLLEFEGSFLALYVLGLACRVPLIRVYDDNYWDLDPGRLGAILAETRPMHLSVTLPNGHHFTANKTELISLCRGFQELATLQDRKSTRLNSSHSGESRMPSSA